jgi:hypothetical protein
VVFGTGDLDLADDGLSAVVDRDMLHRDFLLGAAAVALESLDLRREGAGELGEAARRGIQLPDPLPGSEPACEPHGGQVDGGLQPGIMSAITMR